MICDWMSVQYEHSYVTFNEFRLPTTCSSWCLEDTSNFWIHLNHIFFFTAKLMPFIHSLFYPLFEWLTNYRVDNICHIIPRQLFNLSFDKWKTFNYLWCLCSVFQHSLNFEPVEMRDSNVPHIHLFDLPPSTSNYVPHVEDCHSFIAG